MGMKNAFNKVVDAQPVAFHGHDNQGNPVSYHLSRGHRIYSAIMMILLPLIGLFLAFAPGTFDWATDLVADTNWNTLLERIDKFEELNNRLDLGSAVLGILWSCIAFLSAVWIYGFFISPNGVGVVGGGAAGLGIFISGPLSYFGWLMLALPELILHTGVPAVLVKGFIGILYGPMVLWCEFLVIAFNWMFG